MTMGPWGFTCDFFYILSHLFIFFGFMHCIMFVHRTAHLQCTVYSLLSLICPFPDIEAYLMISTSLILL